MILLFIQGFISVRILDIIDILLVAYLLYEIYRLIRGTVAINIFAGIIAIYLLWKLVKAYDMTLLSEILGQFISVGVIALIIVFQQEIRQFLLLLGTPNFIQRKPKRFFFVKLRDTQSGIKTIDLLMNVCQKMAEFHTGAIIVIARRNELKEFSATGEIIDAKISEPLIESTFYKNNPLHDGAMIILRNRIHAVRCVLPLTKNLDFPADYGLRHRAATGVTEQSDALSVVVSEQTGKLSYCKGGILTTDVTPEELRNFLMKELEIYGV